MTPWKDSYSQRPTWEAIERPNPELVGRYCLGVDLGASASMSAVSAYWPDSGALRVLGDVSRESESGRPWVE